MWEWKNPTWSDERIVSTIAVRIALDPESVSLSFSLSCHFNKRNMQQAAQTIDQPISGRSCESAQFI
ncbi:hypothetical protein T07_14360 [Trichinella nelsoni]|uniref:Uncharacterized protein n=1 Tax=Trichinella nelsoni TaxID=6336 RepID=A0A0V0RZR5_9BILA|nr:hypothetical protein T07_14360 [Trichinella nelsoni]